MPITARKWITKSHFSGLPKREDLEIVEEELQPIKDGEFLCQAQIWSVDPYVRFYIGNLPLGSTMVGAQVAKVLESKSSKYAVGDLVLGPFGWRTHTVVPETGFEEGKDMNQFMTKLDPEIYKGRESAALGVLGMPGATAYFGVTEVLKPTGGETVVVSGAAGAVGSIAGQIAKIKGASKVVGFAGSDDKVAYLKRMGFDEAVNYKTMGSLADKLKEVCPKGVDRFYDNVGGEYFEVVLSQMTTFGRVAVCGCISEYNAEEPPKGRPVSKLILYNQLVIEGFIVMRYMDQWPAAFKQLSQWITEGKLKYEETVTEGFDNMFNAFSALFVQGGTNTGKAIVKA